VTIFTIPFATRGNPIVNTSAAGRSALSKCIPDVSKPVLDLTVDFFPRTRMAA
jgi:hypothetical protein